MKTIPNPERGSANRGCKPGRQRGFSLLEMLVAFSILAVSLGVLLNVFSAGMKSAVAAEDYTAAVQIAESLMARAGNDTPLHQGQADGREKDKYYWRMTIAPFELAEDDLNSKTLPVELFMVTVNVSWDGQNEQVREVELTSLKLTARKL